MIRGVLNDRLEPMVVLEISSGDGRFQSVNALLDTGFGGYLTLHSDIVARLGLEHAEHIPMILADGEEIEASVHAGAVKWFGEERSIDIIAMDGPSLLGMRLLAGCKIVIRAYPGGEVLIEEYRA